jgi:hypothetical protein
MAVCRRICDIVELPAQKVMTTTAETETKTQLLLAIGTFQA